MEDNSGRGPDARHPIMTERNPNIPEAGQGAEPVRRARRARSAMTNAGWNAFSTFWSIAISFLLAPLMIHYLGVAQYGILLVIWSVTGILGIMNFGLGEATLRYVAHYLGDDDLKGVNRVFGATLTFYATVCALVSAVLLLAGPAVATWLKVPEGEYPLVGTLLRLSAAVFSLAIISRAYGSILMAMQRYDVTSRIEICQNVIRSGGYILLVLGKYGLVQLVLWDIVINLATLCTQAVIIRKLAPDVRLIPSFSFRGLKEIIGYSIFSFLTYVFHMMHRESGKLALGTYIGPSPVAYLGTPDNVSQRIHMVIASGSETLLPRFSANRDPKAARSLYLYGTWGALVFSIVFLLPLVVLMPDFLRLWINPEFARESAVIGQLVALSYITQGAFAPPATYFRGSGRPWFVTAVIAVAGGCTLLVSVLLIPSHGILGVGYAYLLGSLAPFIGVIGGWMYMFRSSSFVPLARSVGLPVAMGGLASAVEFAIRGMFPDLTWFTLFFLGGLFVVITMLFVLGADWALGGDSPSKALWNRLGESAKVNALMSNFREKKVVR